MRRLALLAVLPVAAAALILPAGSPAAEPKRPSAALKAYGLDWIQYIRPQDLPPTRYAVCIVDTGVAITPDTPPDDPNGPIVKRLSIDGGSGEPQGTTPDHGHGTRMAATAVAPRNGWGTVGMFPAGRVISVRATVNGESIFRVPQYVRGIRQCLREQVPLAAINLSVGCGDCAPNGALAALASEVRFASERGVIVTVAAGNKSGQLDYPANVPGVVPIAAGGRRGRLCRYSAWSPAVLGIGPACPVESAEPSSGAYEPRADGGTSAAAIEVAGLLASLRTLRPDVSAEETLTWVRNGARSIEGRRVINGRAAARLGGVGSVVHRADKLRRSTSRR